MSMSVTGSMGSGYPGRTRSWRSIRDTAAMPMDTIDLQRRVPGARADELLERLQAALRIEEPVSWNESGHARIPLGREREDARDHVAGRLAELGEDWADHIAIL
jgi:hypothetical protein